MPSKVLNAKNLWDIASFVELTTCNVCQQGPLCSTPPLPEKFPVDATFLTVDLTCSLCGADRSAEFHIPLTAKENTAQSHRDRINEQPSAIVDLAGWQTLFQVFMDRSSQATDSASTRKFALDARKCLDEGLLFYDTPDDDPPPDAFFSKESLARFHAQPEHYSRQRLINLRAPLPKQSKL